MENDKKLEQDKQAFYAQYYGQKVAMFTQDNEQYGDLEVGTKIPINIITKIRLSNIASITDEHAIGLAKLIWDNPHYHTAPYGRSNVTLNLNSDRIDFDQRVTDFLRRNGYLLPYAGYTTDRILSMGWAKLKQQ